MENTRTSRYGVNRWIVLVLIILMVIAASLFRPVQPHILVAPERVTHAPLISLPVLGDIYLTNTLTTMLLVDLIVILIALAVRSAVSRGGDGVLTGIAGVMEAAVDLLYNMAESTAGRYTRLIFPWFASFIIVVLISNWMGLIPGMESIGTLEHAEEEGHAAMALLPGVNAMTAGKGEYAVVPWFRGMSTDLNFTAALALLSIIATQVIGFQTQGLRYLLRFFNVTTLFKKPFFGVMDLIVSLLELVSEFSKILSFAFRLFGNMFAGMVLLFLITSMVPYFAPAMIMTFEFFIGLIQAYVFGMLTLVFMSQATQGHGEHDEEHHE